MPELLIIDRFEGDHAVCEREDRTTVDIARAELPRKARVGDVLRWEADSWRVDATGTATRRKRIADLAAGLWQREQ